MNDNEYQRALGARLRQHRQYLGLSLIEVEEKSGGEWKAVVIGSYERGDRSISAMRLAKLADFYHCRSVDLLPESAPLAASETPPHVTINLPRLEKATVDANLLRRFVAYIRTQRGDYNTEWLSLRQTDIRDLALIHGITVPQMVGRLKKWDVLNVREPVSLH